MNRCWWMAGLAMVVIGGNTGCWLDNYKGEQRANQTLEEDLARARSDLADAQRMLQEKDVVIDGLRKQLGTKEQALASCLAESSNLRDALAKAQAILEKMAGTGAAPPPIVVRTPLPAPVDSALKKLADEHPNVLDYDPAKGVVRWKSDLLFPLGSDQLADPGEEVMQAMAKFAEIVRSSAASGLDVIIVGHTCNTPIRKAATLAEHKTNWHLSTHRAIAVMNMLGQLDVAMARMGIMGYGEYRPIADNTSESGKAKNRRV